MGQLALALCLVGLVSLGAAALADRQPDEPSVEVAVDPRVELMSIIWHLAGSQEYATCAIPCYQSDVTTHFGQFKDHPAVKEAARLRDERGINYNAPMSLAVHLTDAYSLDLRRVLDPLPPGIDARWQADDAQAFLSKARAFVKDSDFRRFIADHQLLYDETVKRMQETLRKNAHVEWFGRFYATAPGARFHVILGMVNGPNSYGASFRDAAHDEVYAVQGVWELSDDGTPRFGYNAVLCVVHELSHSYVNPIVDKHADEMRPAGEKLYELVEERMEQMAYGAWYGMIAETIIRACEVRYCLTYGGEESAQWLLDYERKMGFDLVEPLSVLLGEYERNREKYPTLESFLPTIVAFLEERATGADATPKP